MENYPKMKPEELEKYTRISDDDSIEDNHELKHMRISIYLNNKKVNQYAFVIFTNSNLEITRTMVYDVYGSGSRLASTLAGAIPQ